VAFFVVLTESFVYLAIFTTFKMVVLPAAANGLSWLLSFYTAGMLLRPSVKRLFTR